MGNNGGINIPKINTSIAQQPHHSALLFGILTNHLLKFFALFILTRSLNPQPTPLQN